MVSREGRATAGGGATVQEGFRMQPVGRATIVAAVAALSVAAGATGAAGCGPSVRIEPLIGEEQELLQYVATTVPDLRDHAPTRAARELHDALVREDMAAAWELLSADTRAALDEAARLVSAPSGRELFLAAPKDGLPLTRDGAPPVMARPLQWLLADDIASWRLTLDPEEPPAKATDEAIVYLVDPEDRYREVRLRREDGVWRVHQPSLRYADVVAFL